MQDSNGALSQEQFKKITPEDIWLNKTFQPKSIAGLQSMESGLTYTALEDKKRVVQYSYETGEPVKTLLDIDELKPKRIKEIESYSVSENEQRIVFATNIKKIYRHSFSAKYYIWDIESKTLTPLSTRKDQQLATFSPNADKIAFVSNNNLFIKDIESGVETQITSDGRYNHVINGKSDWVYEEEFALRRAFEWSPDGNYLAYLRFDESQVKEFTMLKYNGEYPEKVTYKYPRAGEKNAIVSAYTYDLSKQKTQRIDVGDESDQYILRIKWTKKPGIVTLFRLNRLQNQLDYLLCNASDGTSKVLHTEKNDRYIDPDDSLTFLNDGKHFIVTSEKTGYQHVYLYNMDGKEVRALTSGEWDATRFIGYNEHNGRAYYTAALPTPMQRTLFSVKLDGTDLIKLSTEDGVNNSEFSNGLRYYINTYSTANKPPVISLHDDEGRLVRVLEDNSKLSELLKDYKTSRRDFFNFATSEGVKLNAWMVKPTNFDSNKQYPVLMVVYGGPNSQTVMDSWEFDWTQYLAQEGYIVVSVDGRGTGGRGEDFRKCTYQQLGKYEVIDQIEGAKYLGTLPYVDASRIAMFGWSYGGFMASGCILRGCDTFKAAIAVASVTNFRYYDTIYTERFMRTPQENPTGYDENAPLAFAENLKGKFLLIHGITDDNVHHQNSLELVEALIKADKDFELHFLPNRDHGIYGGNTRLHLYRRMTDFLNKNL